MQNGVAVVDLSIVGNWGKVTDKNIYMIRLDDEPAVKRLRWAKLHKTLAVISDNPAEDEDYKDVDALVLYGRVIWVWGEHKERG
jgi:phage repressor protein C with HTH and peptisase S24 domain